MSYEACSLYFYLPEKKFINTVQFTTPLMSTYLRIDLADNITAVVCIFEALKYAECVYFP